jgi:hypothetical protein
MEGRSRQQGATIARLRGQVIGGDARIQTLSSGGAFGLGHSVAAIAVNAIAAVVAIGLYKNSCALLEARQIRR